MVLSTEMPPGPGGIGIHAHQLAAAGKGAGWEVTVVSPQDYVDADQRAEFNRSVAYDVVTVDRRGSPLRRALRRFRVSRRVLRDRSPDVVLATGERSVWLAALLLGRRRPWVAYGHGAEYGTGVTWRRVATRAALRRSRAAVCNSEYTLSALRDLRAKPPRSTVIEPGADVDGYHPDQEAGAAFRSDHGLGDAPLVVTVGNVSARKGQDLVVRALADRRLATTHYLMVGLPSSAAELVDQARRLGVTDRVHVLGALPESALIGVYNAADVFAMTSRHDEAGDFEGYGIAVIEAALCARPAVVTSGSGLAEAVVHGETGLVVPAEDADAIAGALATLLDDDGRRRELGRAAAQRARRNNDWSDLITRFAAVFDQAIGGPPPAEGGLHLAVISDTPYYATGSEVVGWGPTVRELDHLAGRFGTITHVAPRYEGRPPRSALPHRNDRVVLRAVESAGGTSLRAKLGVLARYPAWARAIRGALVEADAVHVRCPSNISILALALLAVSRRRRPAWVKFGGNWRPDGGEHWTYLIQRRWLRRGVAGAVVTVNGRWADEPDHVVPFHNPTLDDEDLARGRAAAEAKDLDAPYRLAFVGRLDRAKGAGRALAIALALRERDLPVELHVVGDGALGASMRRTVADERAEDVVAFHGWLPRAEVETVYGLAHFLLLPTDSEGFPKVLAEAMAFGAVPLAGAVSSIPRTLGEIGTGVALGPTDVDGFAAAIEAYVAAPETWRRERRRGVDEAARFSYGRYLEDVDALFRDHLGLTLGPPEAR